MTDPAVPATTPAVSVLVVTHNSADDVGRCVDAVPAEVAGAPVETLVFDSGSTDGTVDVVRTRPHATVVADPANVGFAAGMNRLLARARAARVLLLNPDVVLDPGCLERLVAHLDAAPAGLGGVAAMLRYPDGRPQWFARREPTLSDVWWGLTWLGRALDRRIRRGRGERRRTHRERFEGGGDVVVVDSPIAACVLLPRRLLGPAAFDETFPLYFNDTDLYRRLREQGLRFEVLRTATATHGYGTSTGRAPGPRIRAEYVRSLRRYAARHWDRPRRTALHLLLAVDVLTAGAVWLLGRRSDYVTTYAVGTLGGLPLPGGARPWMDG